MAALGAAMNACANGRWKDSEFNINTGKNMEADYMNVSLVLEKQLLYGGICFCILPLCPTKL